MSEVIGQHFLAIRSFASPGGDEDLVALHAERSALIMEGSAVARSEADLRAAQEFGFESVNALHVACLSAWRSVIDASKPLSTRAELLVQYTQKFLRSHWAREALALGWCEIDLFGVDPECPFVRLDRQGLLPGIAFSSFKLTLDLLSAECAVLTTASGAHQRQWRTMEGTKSVPFWRCRLLFSAKRPEGQRLPDGS
jgi:hypothetical protein